MLTEEKLKNILDFFKIIFRDLFVISLVTYLIFIFLNKLIPGLISNYFNLDNILIVVLIAGSISVLFQIQEKKEAAKKLSWIDIIYILVLTLSGIILVFLKIKQLGALGYGISLFIGFLIFVITYYILKED